MSRYHQLLLASAFVLALVSCDNREELAATIAPATEPPAPTATEPEPTVTPTDVPATSTPEPTVTSEPESQESGEAVSPLGYWEGAIATGGIELSINLAFSEAGDGLSGTIDIPQQGAAGLPLDNITYEGDQIHFEIASVGAVFDGTVTAEDIEGDFVQGAATGTFTVAAAEPPEEEAPQTAEDLPYDVEEVSWDIDDTTVDATLTIPEGDGPFPAVILVAGSGPTDRDWNSPLLPGTNGSGALLADVLTRAGYVTLRYDKRASGPNAAANMESLMGQISLDSHLDEVAGGVALLAENEVVDNARIFALANSEGIIHALNYQRQNSGTPLAGLILAAPLGRRLGEVIRSQLEDQVASIGKAEELMALYDEAMERFYAGEPVEPSPELPEGIQRLLLSFEAPANLPFTREVFVVDPAEWLAEIDVPVLVVIGQKDIQVDWQEDGDRLEEAVSGDQNVTFAYPENANHVLKFEEKAADELTAADGVNYNAADRALDEETVETILDWLEGR